MLKPTAAAVAVTTSFVLAVPTAAQAVVPDAPTTTSPDFNGLVHDVVHKGDTVYVAGDFSSVTDSAGQSHARDGLAAVSSTTGAVLPWSPTVQGSVNKLLPKKEGVYLVGDFTAINGQKRRDVARVDQTTGAVQPGFKHGTNGEVNAIAVSKRKVYLGGEFTKFDGRDRAQLAAVGRRGTSDLRRWKPSATQGPVTDLVRKKAGIYVGGFFHHINGTDRRFLALVTSRRGALVKGFASKVPNVVIDLAASRTRVYAGTGGRANGGGLVSVRRSDGKQVFHRRFDGDVQAVAVMRGTVYAGGHFKTICRRGASQDPSGVCEGGAEATRLRGASLNTDGDLTGWNPEINPGVSDVPGIKAFTKFPGRDALAIGGGFTTVKGENAERFALFD